MAGERSARKTRDRRAEEQDAPPKAPRDETDAETDETDAETEDDITDEDAYDDAPSDDDRAPAPTKRRSSRPSAADAAEAALSQIADLTAKPTLGVTSVAVADEGWTVGIEVLEDRRIPSSSDILALYEADIDMDGTLLSYRRVQRYPRGRGDSTGGV
jgi:hypothetical protein